MRASHGEFRALVEEHQRTVFGIALRLLGDRGEAEEVAQDVFLELHAALSKLQDAEHVRFWLRRVAVHRATDALRRRARRPELLGEVWEEEAHGRQGRPGIGEEMAVRLETLVRSLPEPCRTALVLRYLEDAEPEEIAALTAQPLATVKSHLQRGLGMLRRKAEVVLKEWSR